LRHGGRRFLASPATGDEDGEGDGGRQRSVERSWMEGGEVRAGRRHRPPGKLATVLSLQGCKLFSPTSPV
jgi:hypothetical protein